jgi:ABC-2 type transport system ATP-binding protein
VGPNGAGKTTAMRIALGLAAPSGGSCRVRGRAAGALESFGAHPRRALRDHLRVLCAASALPEARADAVLEEVGLRAVARRPAGECSLGMRRRLSLAGALLTEPDLLVLDEPADGLDPDAQAWLRAALRSHASAGGAVLLSSHALGEVERVADRVVVLAAGRVAAAGTPAELDAPATRVRAGDLAALAAALAARGRAVARDGDALVVAGTTPAEVGEIALAAGVALAELREEGGLEALYARATRAAP